MLRTSFGAPARQPTDIRENVRMSFPVEVGPLPGRPAACHGRVVFRGLVPVERPQSPFGPFQGLFFRHAGRQLPLDLFRSMVSLVSRKPGRVGFQPVCKAEITASVPGIPENAADASEQVARVYVEQAFVDGRIEIVRNLPDDPAEHLPVRQREHSRHRLPELFQTLFQRR